MKFSKKKRVLVTWLSCLLSLLLTVSAFTFLWTYEKESEQAFLETEENTTVLLAGVDEAGYHTDMLMICSFSAQSGAVKLIQLPRDTYFRTENGEGKINRIYAGYVSKYGKKDAAERFCKTISEAFDIPLDGYVIIDARTVRDFVDLLGGVTVDVPSDISYFSESAQKMCTLQRGERNLSGEEAVALVRHRKGYAEGDLGRLDAQMRFLSGVCSGVPKLKKIEQYMTIYQKILPNLLTNLTEKDIIKIMMAYLKNKPAFTVTMMRIPGEALCTDGIWYYAVYRGATERMLSEQLALSGYAFDEGGCFFHAQKEALRNIYNNPSTLYRTFSTEEAAKIRILKN